MYQNEIVILHGWLWIDRVPPSDFIGSIITGNEETSMTRCVQIYFLSNSKYAKSYRTLKKHEQTGFFCEMLSRFTFSLDFCYHLASEGELLGSKEDTVAFQVQVTVTTPTSF